MQKIKDLVINLFLLLFTLFLVFSLLELGLRILEPKQKLNFEESIFQKSDNDILVYELKPNFTKINNEVVVKTNIHGIRDNRIFYNNTIAFIGDSVTLAQTIDFSKTLTKIFENKINNSYDVLNFGVDGYGIKQYTQILKTKVIKFKPKYVFINYVLNDPIRSSTPANYFISKKNTGCSINSLQLNIPCGLKHFIENIKVISFFYGKINNIRNKNVKDYWKAIHDNPDTYQNVIDSFFEIKELSEKHDFNIFIVIFPILNFNKNYEWEYIHEKIKRDALTYDLEIIDLLEVYKEYNDEDLRINDQDYIHPNEFAYELAGKYIAERFKYNLNSLDNGELNVTK